MSDEIMGYDPDTRDEMWYSDIENSFERELSEVYGDITIAGGTFDAGRVYRELDPIGFRGGAWDHYDAMLSDGRIVKELDDDEE